MSSGTNLPQGAKGVSLTFFGCMFEYFVACSFVDVLLGHAEIHHHGSAM
jgi:hypothetical protein